MLELDGIQLLNVFGTKVDERKFLSPYRPEIDEMNFIWDDLQSLYLQIIGLLIQSIEFGSTDIMTIVSVRYQQQYNPRESQNNLLYRIF